MTAPRWLALVGALVALAGCGGAPGSEPPLAGGARAPATAPGRAPGAAANAGGRAGVDARAGAAPAPGAIEPAAGGRVNAGADAGSTPAFAVGTTGEASRPGYEPPLSAERPDPHREEASFLAVGDILLSRQVGAAMADGADALLPFRPLAPLFASVDFCFGNLESPFTSSDFIGRGPAHIFNTPPSHIEGLVTHRFKLLNLANNHALDQGEKGLGFTLEHLASHGIQTVGAGLTEEAAWAGAVVEAQGLRIGFLGASYASVNDNGTLRNRYVARIDDRARLAPAITSLRERSDLVVVTMHAGAEYNPRVVPSQVAFAHAAVDAGADLVIGAHPHVVQRVERYRGVWVLYSLGNFIFDHEPLPTRQGLAAKVVVHRADAASTPHGAAAAAAPPPAGRETVAAPTEPPATDGAPRRARVASIELLPVMIEQRSTPRLATAEEARAILAQAEVESALLPGE